MIDAPGCFERSKIALPVHSAQPPGPLCWPFCCIKLPDTVRRCKNEAVPVPLNVKCPFLLSVHSLYLYVPE
jgi:hypothetical protein